MSLSRRLSTILATMFAATGLLFAGFQPAVPQAPRGKGPQALRAGQEIMFTSPQFVVQALWFKSNDETNWAWMGSDEVYAIFSDMDPTHYDRETSIYGNVDEGDTETFRAADTCMAPQPKCDRGMADLNVRFSFWEHDPIMSFCPGELDAYPGTHSRLEEGLCGADELIGRGSIIYSRDDLVALLPDVGASREFTHVMDKNAGKYRFRYRITRLADAQRTIVINVPSIALQARVVAILGGNSVNLTWSGAISTTIDIYRNGAKLVTTANDGAHTDNVGSGTFQYRVCNLNVTTGCSPVVSVTAP